MRSKRLATLAAVIVLLSLLAVNAGFGAEGGTDAVYNWTSSTTSYVGEFKNTGSGYGLRGYTTGTNSISLYGESYGSAATGMRGYNDSSGYGVYGRAKNGYGTYGETNSTSPTYAGVWGKATSTATGVRGTSVGGIGVYGSGAGDGVEGTTTGTSKSGVWGHTEATNGYGVTGFSTNYFGMLAEGKNTNETDAYGDLLLGGTLGELFTFSNQLNFYSNGNVRVDLDHNNDTAGSWFNIVGGDDVILWGVGESSGTVAVGSQASAVSTASHGQRLMYAVEGTGVWLEDVGTTALAEGVATIVFDPVYAEAANLEGQYQVFVTAKGDQPVLLYVAAQTASGFTVRGVTLDGKPASCAFDYRVVAPRQGYEKVRTEEFAPGTTAQK